VSLDDPARVGATGCPAGTNDPGAARPQRGSHEEDPMKTYRSRHDALVAAGPGDDDDDEDLPIGDPGDDDDWLDDDDDYDDDDEEPLQVRQR